MARPTTHGGKAARDTLDFIDHWLSQVVDLMSEDINFRQRYKLRVQIIRYKLFGDRRKSNDPKVQKYFEYIVLNFINQDETF